MRTESGYPIINEGVALLKEFEGFAKTRPGAPDVAWAYPDPATNGEPWTIAWGFTTVRGVKVRKGDSMTLAEANEFLADELEEYVQGVLDACTVEPNEYQLAAMVVLAWNIGLGWKGASKPKGAKDGFRQSSVLRAHNRGDFQAASRAFGLWNKAAGKVMNGLTRRRAAESALYLKNLPEERSPEERMSGVPAIQMPQEVEPEKPVSKSEIGNAGKATVAVSALSVVAQASEHVSVIENNLGALLPYVVGLAAVVALALGAYTWWQRHRQRKEGWA